MRGVGVVLGSMLALAAALTVANVVRLALYARRDELDIMQLVGAPQVYVRGPFVMEGSSRAESARSLALVVLAVGVFRVAGAVPRAARLDGQPRRRCSFCLLELCLALVVGGMLVGCVGRTGGGLEPLRRPVTES